MGPGYFAKADVSEREGYLVGLRKPGPRSQEFWGEGRDLGNPSGLGLNWKEVGHSPGAPRELKKAKRKGGWSPSKRTRERGGVLKGSWVCLRKGVVGPCRRPTGKARIRLRPTVGGWSRETTPRGAGGVCWASAKAALAAGGGRGEAATAGPGRGEGSTGRRRGLGPWKRALEGHSPAGPLGLSQGGLGHGGWIRQGQGQHSWWPPPPSPRAVLTYVPVAAAATAVGLGVSNTGAPAPLCRAAPSSPPPLALSPRPSELAGRWRERQGGALWLPEPPPLGQPEKDPGETPPPTKLVGPQSRHLENGGGRELCQFSPPPSWIAPLPAQIYPLCPQGPHPHPSESAALSRSIDGEASVNGPRAQSAMGNDAALCPHPAP